MPWLDVFSCGLTAHGVKRDTRHHDYPVPCKTAVVWGMRHPAVFAAQQKAGADVLVLERGYMGDRQRWTSAGFNGLNGRADFRNAGSPADRWEKHHRHLEQPWKDGGDYVLILGQVAGDAATTGLNLDALYTEWAETAKGRWNLPVVFRPHPLARQVAPPGTVLQSGTLAEALAGAKVALTWNSTSGVEAVLAGVPTFALDRGSMVWPVSAHHLDSPLFAGDRSGWAHDLAHAQWTLAEFASGEAWSHLCR